MDLCITVTDFHDDFHAIAVAAAKRRDLHAVSRVLLHRRFSLPSPNRHTLSEDPALPRLLLLPGKRRPPFREGMKLPPLIITPLESVVHVIFLPEPVRQKPNAQASGGRWNHQPKGVRCSLIASQQHQKRQRHKESAHSTSLRSPGNLFQRPHCDPPSLPPWPGSPGESCGFARIPYHAERAVVEPVEGSLSADGSEG